MPIPDDALTNSPTRDFEEILADVANSRISVNTARAALGFPPAADLTRPCECEEDYMCALHGTGVLPQHVRPTWADVATWKHARDVGLLAHTLEDLAGMDATSAAALARTLIPRDGVPVDVEAAVVIREHLRALADAPAGEGYAELRYRSERFLAVSGSEHTRWDAFIAGIRAAAEYRRG